MYRHGFKFRLILNRKKPNNLSDYERKIYEEFKNG